MSAIDRMYVYAMETSEEKSKELLNKIDNFISSGKAKTWKKDTSGYYHDTTDDKQWVKEARLTATVISYKKKDETVEFRISVTLALLPDREKSDNDDAIYGVYLGRFSSLIISHFRAIINQISFV